jgi:hypothetical protein
MPNIKFIIVKTQFEGIHCYPNAPEEVAFLKNPHRHMFHVEAEIEVFHDDRELEFIMVKRELDKFLASFKDINSGSCEMIACKIQSFIKTHYPTYNPPDRKSRYVNVKVFEDGENGAYIKEL